MDRKSGIFFVSVLIVSCWFTDRWITNANTTSRALTVLSVVESGTFCIDRYHEKTKDKSFVNGHYYSDKAPLPALLTIPFFAVMKWTGLVTDHNGSFFGPEVYYLGNFICGSLPFALILLGGLRYMKRKKTKLSRGIVLLMLSFFGSFIFIMAGTFFAHMLSALFILHAWLDMEEDQYVRAGAFTGAAFLCEYTLLLFIPVWLVHLYLKKKSWRITARFLLGSLPPLLFLMFYNYIFTGSPFEMLYKYHTFQELHQDYGFALPSLDSLWGLSFSPYRGLFFYAPVLIIFLAAGLSALRRGNILQRLRAEYVVPASLIFFLFIAGYFGWHGGWTYGPRLLFPIAVLLMVRALPLLSQRTWFPWAASFSFAGILMSLMAKMTHAYSLPTEERNPVVQILWPAVKQGAWNGNDVLSMITGQPSGTTGLVYLLLLGLLAAGMYLWYSGTENESAAEDPGL
ncbi:MAG: hypothetical protein IT233_05070 [Bacteroidia bacterium]|nr:hypothetical protein [Bacteroidia bacterium]